MHVNVMFAHINACMYMCVRVHVYVCEHVASCRWANHIKTADRKAAEEKEKQDEAGGGAAALDRTIYRGVRSTQESGELL